MGGCECKQACRDFQSTKVTLSSVEPSYERAFDCSKDDCSKERRRKPLPLEMSKAFDKDGHGSPCRAADVVPLIFVTSPDHQGPPTKAVDTKTGDVVTVAGVAAAATSTSAPDDTAAGSRHKVEELSSKVKIKKESPFSKNTHGDAPELPPRGRSGESPEGRSASASSTHPSTRSTSPGVAQDHGRKYHSGRSSSGRRGSKSSDKGTKPHVMAGPRAASPDWRHARQDALAEDIGRLLRSRAGGSRERPQSDRGPELPGLKAFGERGHSSRSAEAPACPCDVTLDPRKPEMREIRMKQAEADADVGDFDLQKRSRSNETPVSPFAARGVQNGVRHGEDRPKSAEPPAVGKRKLDSKSRKDRLSEVSQQRPRSGSDGVFTGPRSIVGSPERHSVFSPPSLVSGPPEARRHSSPPQAFGDEACPSAPRLIGGPDKRGTAMRCSQRELHVTDGSVGHLDWSSESSRASSCGAPQTPLRQRCKDGLQCSNRNAEHLASMTHPLDGDYKAACEAEGVKYENPTLHAVFTWADFDRSGKVSLAELRDVLPLLVRASGGALSEQLSAQAWERLDVDGNGAVNFFEFADWAGPRLGLALGVDRILEDCGTGCGVLGCLCAGFVPEDGSRCAAQATGARGSRDGGAQRSSRPTLRRGHSGVTLCARCHHKRQAHCSTVRVESGGVPLPRYWLHPRGSDFSKQVPLRPDQFGVFQELFDRTYLRRGTRDRVKNGIPRAYRVVNVFRNENSWLWKRYYVARGTIISSLEDAALLDELGPPELYTLRSGTALEAQHGSDGVTDQLQKRCNEWYAFHGTSSDAAKLICSSGFKMSFAGSHAGTLYGKGTYFAESVTKSDEYSSESSKSGTCVLLLCRVLGGRVKYTAERKPDPEELVSACIEGPFDSVMGDREKCKGTFREICVFDSEGLYPEFIIEYKRVM
eukprot:TRINITY_DN22597_c0_g1_i1.p1 TRINITY_DN22597_c0_g1~~TRINITY_DN22597_c0_g1_i1.p1  ORF type:complete len:953 (-),score=115.99 TRINITY_DN22597_c0_g1_i1:122-2908(-)